MVKPERLEPNDTVYNDTYGLGFVAAIDGNTVIILFDESNERLYSLNRAFFGEGYDRKATWFTTAIRQYDPEAKRAAWFSRTGEALLPARDYESLGPCVKADYRLLEDLEVYYMEAIQ